MSSRLSLHDCTLSVRIASTASIASSDPPETIALQALANHRDKTEAYIGETIFLLATLTPPDAANTSSDSLQRALQSYDDPHVYIGSLPHAASLEKPSCRLPILRETAWIPARHDGGHLLCRGMWALVRSPLQPSHASRALAMAGRQNLVLSLRERDVPNLKNSSVWATIDRASRLFGKSVALYATRYVLLSMPIEISCQCVSVENSLDKTLINVTARNSTGDAYLSVVPPYINVSSSRIVAQSSAENSHGRSVPLDHLYEFVLLTDDESDDDSTLTNLYNNRDMAVSKQSSEQSCEDYGLFIPSFNHLIRHAATLGPREVYNFVYRIIEKRAHTAPQGEGQDREDKSQSPPWKAYKLTAEQCVQTSVAVAWNCSPRDDNNLSVYSGETVTREMSAGGILAAGKRSTVAVHVTSINWRPAVLLMSLLVSISGPDTAVLGNRICISIRVVNQTDFDLRKVRVKLQQDDTLYGLLALRTVVVVGDILAGGESSLQVPCVAIGTGTLGVGRVQIVDETGVVWISDSEFRVIVAEGKSDGDEVDDVTDTDPLEKVDTSTVTLKT